MGKKKGEAWEWGGGGEVVKEKSPPCPAPIAVLLLCPEVTFCSLSIFVLRARQNLSQMDRFKPSGAFSAASSSSMALNILPSASAAEEPPDRCSLTKLGLLLVWVLSFWSLESTKESQECFFVPLQVFFVLLLFKGEPVFHKPGSALEELIQMIDNICWHVQELLPEFLVQNLKCVGIMWAVMTFGLLLV